MVDWQLDQAPKRGTILTTHLLTLLQTKLAQIILESLTWDQPEQFPPALSTGRMWIRWTHDTASVDQRNLSVLSL